MSEDEKLMSMALQEARKGDGHTSPNPAVGAVIIRDGGIVGRGYHKKAGTPHAEVNALSQAGDSARGGTMYVTLEPCNHSGRTPPCSQAVLKAGVKKVVVGMPDPNPQVEGGGAAFLKSHGVEVIVGVLEEECRWLHRAFIKHVVDGIPWIILKAGLSLDGRIAAHGNKGGWITNEKSRRRVHRIRDYVDAIMVGVGTALADNPSLTTRIPAGGKDPVRVVLDTHLRMQPTAKMLNQKSSAPTWIFCGNGADEIKQKGLEGSGAVVHRIGVDKKGHLNLPEVLQKLGKENVNSLLVEGGAEVHGTLIRQGLADEAMFFIAPLILGGDGVPLIGPLGYNNVADGPRLQRLRTRRYGDDILVQGVFPWAMGHISP